MKRVFWLLALMGAVLLSAAPVPADDGFYVIAGRYTPGTKITSLPRTITAPGYYYLTGNLSFASGTGITVGSGVNDVTIDLMGFLLNGTSGAANYGILAYGDNFEVRNGSISGCYTAVAGGGNNQRAIGVRAIGDTSGIILGNNALIKGCTATQGSTVGYYAFGVSGGTITGCTVFNFTQSTGGGVGSLYIGGGGGTASDNLVLNCTGSKGIRTAGPATISNNAVTNCATGIANEAGGSITDNVVVTNTGQTGIAPSTSAPSLLDQNSVQGAGAPHYGPGTSTTFYGLNSP